MTRGIEMQKLVHVDVTLAVMVSVDAKNPSAAATDKVLELMQSITYGADTDSSILDYAFGDVIGKGEVDPDTYDEGDTFE
jgi:hypothetical protein